MTRVFSMKTRVNLTVSHLRTGGDGAPESLLRVLGTRRTADIERADMNGPFLITPRSRLVLRYAVATAALSLPSTVVSAQRTPTNRAVTEIAFTLDGLYQSNVAQANADLAAMRGLHRSDFRVTPGVNFTLVRPFGRNTLRLNGFAGYDFYTRNHNLDRERLGLNANAGLNFGPCLVSLRPSVVRRQSQLSQIYFIDTPGIDSVRNTEMVQVYAGDVRCGRTFGLRPVVGYEHSIGDNSNSLRKISDYRGDRYFGGVGYNNPSLGNFTLTYEHNRIVYPHRDLLLSPLLADRYAGNTVRLEAERDIGSIVTLKGSVAYFTVKPPVADVRDFKGFGWRLDGTIRPASRLQITLTTEHQPQPSLGAEALYSIESKYGALATYALTSRTSLFLGGDLDRRDYRGATGVFGPVLTDDRLTRLRAGATLAFSPRVRLTAEAGHETRNANGSIYDYSNTFIGLGARYAL
jgi:hypothetical protein